MEIKGDKLIKKQVKGVLNTPMTGKVLDEPMYKKCKRM